MICDDRVVAVQRASSHWIWWGPRTRVILEMIVVMIEHFQPMCFSNAVRSFICGPDGLTRRTISRIPLVQPSRVFSPVNSATK